MFYKNLLQTIGNTPMVKLNNLIKNENINIYAKLENQNPSGSVKDRVALYMIEQAEKKGKLNKNKIILEATSGNMGIALAMVGKQKGYRVKIIMSAGMSEERKKILKIIGAELILTNKKLGTQGALKLAKKMHKQNPGKYWLADQFNNPDNIKAYYNGLATEILKEIPKIDFLIIGSGTSGTLMGITTKFKKYSPQTKIIGVIPPAGYKIQGLQNPNKDFIGKIFNPDLINEKILVTEKQSLIGLKLMGKKEGLFVGPSSGANIFVATKKAEHLKSGNIVVIIHDKGEKYLSTKLFK